MIIGHDNMEINIQLPLPLQMAWFGIYVKAANSLKMQRKKKTGMFTHFRICM